MYMRWLTFPNSVITLIGVLAIALYIISGDVLTAVQAQVPKWLHSIIAVDAQILGFLGASLIVLSFALSLLAGHRGESQYAAGFGAIAIFASSLEFLSPLNAVVALLILCVSILLILTCLFLLIQSNWWRALVILLLLLLLYDTRAILLLAAVFPVEIVEVVRLVVAIVVVIGLAIWLIFEGIRAGVSNLGSQARNRQERSDKRRRKQN